jgi:hypothetical protein
LRKWLRRRRLPWGAGAAEPSVVAVGEDVAADRAMRSVGVTPAVKPAAVSMATTSRTMVACECR